MFEMFADLMRDRFFSDVYLGIAFAVMVLPMVALTYWYHANVNKTQGGRALMQANNHRSSGRLGSSVSRNLTDAAGMARNILSGRYGNDVRSLQNKTYRFVFCWLVANVIVFGALIWVVNYNEGRAASAAQQIAAETAPK